MAFFKKKVTPQLPAKSNLDYGTSFVKDLNAKDTKENPNSELSIISLENKLSTLTGQELIKEIQSHASTVSAKYRSIESRVDSKIAELSTQKDKLMYPKTWQSLPQDDYRNIVTHDIVYKLVFRKDYVTRNQHGEKIRFKKNQTIDIAGEDTVLINGELYFLVYSYGYFYFKVPEKLVKIKVPKIHPETQSLIDKGDLFCLNMVNHFWPKVTQYYYKQGNKNEFL